LELSVFFSGTMEIRTLCDIFYRSVGELRKSQQLRVKRDGVWHDISSDEFRQAVEETAAGLGAIGVEPGDRVAILAENRPEWAYVDIGCLCSRAITVPIHASLPPQQVLRLLNDSGASILFVSNETKARMVAGIRGEALHLRQVFSMDSLTSGLVPGLDEVRSKGRARLAAQPGWAKEEAGRLRPSDVATIIYTSGTTGEPKGVMLTHDNITSNVQMASSCFIELSPTDTALSMLPLSHIFERMCGQFLMLYKGCTIAYAESPETMADNMREVRPTVVFSVPRFYEKIHARIRENISTQSAVRQKIFHWAVGVGRAAFRQRLGRVQPGIWTRLKYSIADRLVFSKIRGRTGGRIRAFISGGAPIAIEIVEFFGAAGLVILEGYGLSETGPVIAVSSFERMRPGSPGPPIEGIEVRFSEDGEILTRGRHIMKGYFNQPEATAEAIDSDGWFHTGDLGVIRDGFLMITGRKKDLIATSGGKKIAPQPIEHLLKADRRLLDVVMVGNNRHFVAALVVPDYEMMKAWAAEQGIANESRDALVMHPRVVAHYQSIVAEKTAHLAPFERIGKIALVPKEFGVESGELTPKLSLKRHVVEEKYKPLIDRMYDGNR
jgi:long-chain acyl-CoA synthetase